MRSVSVPRVVLAVVALAVAACGGERDDADAVSSTTSSSPATTTSTAAQGGAPLTGLAADPAVLKRPALVVKIDNAPKGRPQAGVNDADVVVEEGVEGGITRLAAVFHSTDAPAVGPVRSARSTDIAIAVQLGRPLFAYSGANAVFAELVRSSPLVDVGVGRVPAAYRREPGRPSLYDLFSSTAELFAAAPDGLAPPRPLFTYRRAGEKPPADAPPAPVVEAEWRDRVRTHVVYEWDAAAGGFARTQNGTAHVDAAGRRVAPENVVFQVVDYRDTGLVDRSGAAVPEAVLEGEGEVVVLTAGKLVRGRWRSGEGDTPTRYVDTAGKPIRLTRGRTWVELVPTGRLTVR